MKGMYALYFHSRVHFSDQGTWAKEALPSDYTEQEVEQAARLAGAEGFTIVNFETQTTQTFKWFV